MQEKNNSLLEAEIRDMEDALMYVLIEETKGALSLQHAMLMLIQKGLVKTEVIRNNAIRIEYLAYIKNPLNKVKTMDVYTYLAAKYDLSQNHIRTICKQY